jgi:prepilin-type N-terminal cleavage/methylation domain-containing protein/prepilin-type processing-associated H-X9-DG protein
LAENIMSLHVVGHSRLARKVRAFTLVELLVVIGIIALLISILLPSLSKARQSAIQLQCLSNLRNIGNAIQLYANQYQDSLPIGTWDGLTNGNTGDPRTPAGTDFSILLQDVMIGTGASYADASTAPNKHIFKCPAASQDYNNNSTMLGTANNALHYTAHPRLMGNIDQWNAAVNHWGMAPYHKSQIRNSGEIVLLWDGQQIRSDNGVASPEGYGLDAFRLFFDHLCLDGNPAFDPSVSVDGGKNVDAPDWGTAGDIRWRHGSGHPVNGAGQTTSGDTANFLFVDGHAAPLRYHSENQTELLRRNIMVNQVDQTVTP